MHDYSEPFWIREKRGNNELSFEERERTLGVEPHLFVPSLVEGGLELLKQGEEVVFEDFDEFDRLQSCKGLAHLLRTQWGEIPMVVVDNHNHVFYFWWEAVFAGRLQRGASLVHIDQHKDMRVPAMLFEGKTLEDVFEYTNFHLNVGNYIVPAQKSGLVGDVQFVTSELAMEDLSFVSLENKILNIDLDFFAPELDYIDFLKAKQFIHAQLPTTTLITVATSPFFIEQERAIDILWKLLQN